ncbi:MULTISPECIES: type II toxin-antitoxin system VapB family antitoxin [Nocardiopsis]|uniref:type II toxin-antitoxin system VapB family antitoxin n=1 Tax=Nocardiopsis TaxID=2013 RepID=UPI00034BD0EE|nr:MULTISPECIES: type II toxin-antitoxin system VapB family antitoxin [Nocardiopsis]
MTRITIDVNDEWLEAAREELGTGTKVATINAALASFADRRKAKAAIEAFDEVDMDFEGSSASFGYGGGRDLSRLAEEARERKAG